MKKYKNKYRIQSHRKPNWDNSGNGLYFLTIVTQNRVCNLGEIINNEMILSDFGLIVETQWLKSFEIRDELIMDTYILMPNHLHAIVEIAASAAVQTYGRLSVLRVRAPTPIISDDIDFKLKRNPPIRLPKSISSFIAGFKSAVNTKIDDYIDENNLSIPKYNRNNHFFQPNYHDHIIRDHFEYQNIRNGIINNPERWNNDKFNG